jgi:hypothetical protein
MFKHQSNCYRIINGIKYTNYADLVYSEKENNDIIIEAKKQFKDIKIITRARNLKSVFVKKCIY